MRNWFCCKNLLLRIWTTLKWLLAAAAFGMSAFYGFNKTHAIHKDGKQYHIQLYGEKITSGMRIYGDIWKTFRMPFPFQK